ncbi:site-specific DNA-methyltransferase [Rufibacter tibetensis]|uniref:site-specific DNA-methyltransferase n=1 Tax=Rufibacter tibetensis TaxID=512763 RepID=UPI00147063B8|nr:site-specific DNA-methyltransferase [Rufibacter tibetensis]
MEENKDIVGMIEEVLMSKEEIKEKSKLTKEEWRDYTKTVWHIANTSHSVHPAVFPPEIPKRLIKLFSFYGETVLDPFAGTGTTGSVANQLGRDAVLVDQNPDYIKIIQQGASELKFNEARLKVIHGDSRKLDSVEDNSIDLIITSPPYWNKADYGESEANIGTVSGYNSFLTAIRPVFEECFRVLTPGRKICIVTANVNQHTDHGLLTFPLAADFTIMLRELGFVMISEVIWSKDGTGGKWGSSGEQRPIFGSYPYPPNFLFKNVHEYVIIFSKPALKKTKGTTVLPYDQLMD